MVKLVLTLFATKDVAKMRTFYREILQVEPRIYGENSCEFPTPGGSRLFIEEPTGINEHCPGGLRTEPNPGVLLDFEVDDPDAHYARLSKMGLHFDEPIRTDSYGHRLFRFRDPDGNLLCFFKYPDRHK